LVCYLKNKTSDLTQELSPDKLDMMLSAILFDKQMLPPYTYQQLKQRCHQLFNEPSLKDGKKAILISVNVANNAKHPIYDLLCCHIRFKHAFSASYRALFTYAQLIDTS
jgi:hypothetical protein